MSLHPMCIVYYYLQAHLIVCRDLPLLFAILLKAFVGYGVSGAAERVGATPL